VKPTIQVPLPKLYGEVWGEVNTGTVEYTDELTEKLERLVLLNALVPASCPAAIATRPATVAEAKVLAAIAAKVESYIGHEATAQLLSQLLQREVPASRAMYVPRNGDVALVSRLKKRLEKVEDVRNVKPEDVEFLIARYYLFSL